MHLKALSKESTIKCPGFTKVEEQRGIFLMVIAFNKLSMLMQVQKCTEIIEQLLFTY